MQLWSTADDWSGWISGEQGSYDDFWARFQGPMSEMGSWQTASSDNWDGWASEASCVALIFSVWSFLVASCGARATINRLPGSPGIL